VSLSISELADCESALQFGWVCQQSAIASAPSIEDMSIDHRRFNTFMTQQFLDGADVIAVFGQVSGKTVAQGVATHSCLNACGA